MQPAFYHDSSGSSCLRHAADELGTIAKLELYLLRIDQGISPFSGGARAFLDALRASYAKGKAPRKSPRIRELRRRRRRGPLGRSTL